MSEARIEKMPKHWKATTFGEIAQLLRGVSYKKPDASNKPELGKVPVLRANNIGHGLNFNKLVYVPAVLVKPEQFIKKGDIIIAMSSGSKHLVGKSAQANEDYPGGYGAFCANLRVSEKINAKYVAYFYSSPKNLKLISAASSGSNINNLKREHILNAPIPIAPYEQQKLIVAKIEELFSHIDAGVIALNSSKKLLKQYRQSVLKSAVTGELTKQWREKNEDDLGGTNKLLEQILIQRRKTWEAQQLGQFEAKGKIPKGNKWKDKYKEPETPTLNDVPNTWIPVTLDQITEYITSGSRGWAKFYSESGATFIRAQNLKHDELRLDDVAFVTLPNTAEGMRTRVKLSDILITITGANVTKTGIVNLDIDEGYVSQHVALCRMVLPKCAEYIYQYLISKEGGRKHLEAAAYGAGKPGLNLENIKTLNIPLPSLVEQVEIKRVVQERLDKIEHLQGEIDRQLTQSVKQKQSILASAFSGKLI